MKPVIDTGSTAMLSTTTTVVPNATKEKIQKLD